MSSAQPQPYYADVEITSIPFQPEQGHDICDDEVASNNVAFLKAVLVMVVISVVVTYIASIAICLKSRYEKKEPLETGETQVECKCIQSLEPFKYSHNQCNKTTALSAEEEASTLTAKTDTVILKTEPSRRAHLPFRKGEDPALVTTDPNDVIDVVNARKTMAPTEDKSRNGQNETVTEVASSSRAGVPTQDDERDHSPCCRVAEFEVAVEANEDVVEDDKPVEHVINVNLFRQASRECTSTNMTRSSAALRDRPGTYYENVSRSHQGF